MVVGVSTVMQVQTHLPKTKCVWPMKINAICTVPYGSTISRRSNSQGSFFGSHGKVSERSGNFFQIFGVNPDVVVENYIAIFAMPVAVSEIRVGQRSICDI